MAFDSETTLIAVSPSAESEHVLEIWGTAFIKKPMKKGLDLISVYSPIYADLAVSSESPGSLTISRGGKIIGRLIDGKFIKPKPSPFSTNSLGRYIFKIIQSHEEYHEFENSYWLLYRDFLEYLLLQAHKRGKGGTIIWLPKETVSSVVNEIEEVYDLGESPNGTELLGRICELSSINFASKTEPGRYFLDMAKKKVVGYIEFLAQLANIDGALIIDENLKILSFGSKIKTETWKGKILTGPHWPVDRSEYIDMSQYGTRHNSSLNFVGKNKGSVALVLSQDGTITGLTKTKKDLVFYWKDLLSGLFDD